MHIKICITNKHTLQSHIYPSKQIRFANAIIRNLSSKSFIASSVFVDSKLTNTNPEMGLKNVIEKHKYCYYEFKL